MIKKGLIKKASSHQKYGKETRQAYALCSESQDSRMPKFLIVRPMVENKKISAKDQQDYWLSIGRLLYLVKHLHPNLANMTRELSKASTRNSYM